MNKPAIKKLLLTLFLTFSSFISSSVFAWPEVDHMNMCGAASKTVRAYGGAFQGWQNHDSFVSKRGNTYYLRTNCPKTVAPVAKKKVTKKKSAKKVVKFTKSSKSKAFRRTVKYDEKADCARVDRMNGYGATVKVLRRR